MIEQLVRRYRELDNMPDEDRDAIVLDYIYELDEAFDGDEDALLAEVKRIASAAPADTGGSANRGRQAPAAPTRRVDRVPWEKHKHADLITAPFRFADLNRKVALLEKMPRLDRPVPGYLSATLAIEWAVETPLLIGDSEDKDENAPATPFALGNDWAIPGASLRGMLRSALETVAFGRMWQVNRHARFGLRNFDHPHYRQFLQRLLKRDEQKAGWLERRKGTYCITPCNWGYVRIVDLLDEQERQDQRALTAWVEATRQKKYGKLKLDWQSANAFRRPWKFQKGEPHSSHPGRDIWRPHCGEKEGYPVLSGPVPGRGRRKQKSYEYMFFDTADEAIELPQEVWEVFETANCKPAKNKRIPDGAWEELHRVVERGGRVPVFYVGDPKNAEATEFSFGLTRLYRLPHRGSVGALLEHTSMEHRPRLARVKQRNEPHPEFTELAVGEEAASDDRKTALQPEFVEALFGYVHEPADVGLDESTAAPRQVARRGRVAVGFARAAQRGGGFALWPPADKPAIATVMGPPKPSFEPFYLIGPDKDYSAASSKTRDGSTMPQLAGRKRYIPRHPANGDRGESEREVRRTLEKQLNDLKAVNRGRDTSKVESRLRFLRPEREDAAFRGEIRLHNVSAAELGALLWVLTFGGRAANHRHLLGRGKPFGAGQVYVRQMTLTVRPNDGPLPEDIAWRTADGRAGLERYLNAFEEEIAVLAGFGSASEWFASGPVRGFLATAVPVGWKAEGYAYLSYQERGDRGQAQRFQELRKAASSPGAQERLLPAVPEDGRTDGQRRE